MIYNELGNTGLTVSKLCFGSLTMGPLQAELSLEKGSKLLAKALDMGVNFVDTADLYGTYNYIKEAINISGVKPIIASKSYAYTAEDMAISLDKALEEIDVDCIDIFLLHEQESMLTMKGHRSAFDYLLEAKRKGLVKAVGISTHTVAAVKAAPFYQGIDVIHPLLNKEGIGIKDGTAAEMLKAIKDAQEMGIGIYAMKSLAGGHLLKNYKEAFSYVLSQESVSSIAVGIQSINELEANIKLFNGENITDELSCSLKSRKRQLFVQDWCSGCGQCVKICPQGALHIDGEKVKVDQDNCVFCGYCGAQCPEFCLKVI